LTEPTVWHALSGRDTLESLRTSADGLTEEESRSRLARFGPNELQEKKGLSAWKLFLGQFKSFLIIILLIAVVLSAILGEVVDAAVILIIVIFATILGFIQEYRAERSLEALRRMTAPTATVLRGGQEQVIPAREVVPGDITLIATGDRVPGDARLLEAVNLKTDEAALTGESMAVEKTTEPLSELAVIGDRRNMVFSGTTAVYGRGRAVVTTTGMNTEFGQIASMLQEVEERATPLQMNLDRLGKFLALGAITIVTPIATLGVIRGHEPAEMFVWGVSLAVAVVPEALPAVVTIGLAIGVQMMAKRNALIRKLTAVETLGSTTVICSDKTGTLTQDQMTVRQVFINGELIDVTGGGYEPVGQFLRNGSAIDNDDIHLQRLLQSAALCNDSRLVEVDGTWEIRGDPTEGALVVLAAKGGVLIEKIGQEYPRLAEIPFSSERKRMSTVHASNPGRIVFGKGAPEVILDLCRYQYIGGEEVVLSGQDRERILEVNREMASKALRVLGLVHRAVPSDSTRLEEIEHDSVFIGLVGMIDPPRAEAKEAIEVCRRAGIKSVMITGDHMLTALAVATELNLATGGPTLTGEEMNRLSGEELEDIVDSVEVYARVSPAHKLQIVEALQKKNHVVAMTGDGVNDAPALKKADVGVAMGITGTDVSKEAADMVLTDDNFASIVSAVEEGRGVFANIQKFLTFLLSSNLGEVSLMAVAILAGPLLGLPFDALPLIAVQILYVNLATDGLPAIALAVERKEKDTMERPTRRRGEGFFNRLTISYIVGLGLWTGAVALAAFMLSFHYWGYSIPQAQGFAFVTLILVQFFNAFNCRSLRHSVFGIGLFTNRWLLLAITWEILLLSVVIYLPFLQNVFNTYAFGPRDWMTSLLLASSILVVAELAKMIGKLGDTATRPVPVS
jgi:Ca2+-transporting ATPase